MSVKKVIVLRHSLKGCDGELTNEGISLAIKVGERIKKHHKIAFAISSPEGRAIKTAGIITEHNCPIQIAEEVGIPEKDMTTVLKLFGKLGNKSLATYCAEGKDVEEKLSEYGRKAWEVIMEASAERNCVLVVGHEVLIGAIGAAATNQTQLIMNAVFDECNGFIVTVEDDQVTAVRLFKN